MMQNDFQSLQKENAVLREENTLLRALCHVHHLRELLFLDEVEKQTWTGEMKTLLLEMKTAVEQAQSEAVAA